MQVLGIDLSTKKLSVVIMSNTGAFFPFEREAKGKKAEDRFDELVLWVNTLVESLSSGVDVVCV